jgi:hypothetical protein
MNHEKSKASSRQAQDESKQVQGKSLQVKGLSETYLRPTRDLLETCLDSLLVPHSSLSILNSSFI